MSDSTTSDSTATDDPGQAAHGRWYDGVTRYQWLVLAIASAGWVFDVFEGQLFAIYKTPAMNDVLGDQRSAELVDLYSNYALASFLVGGALGGLVFGILADRIGRRQSMVWSILVYSLFTGLHYFAFTWWHIVALRFFVAMGVGGEWAIAASLVSEVFPKRARAAAGGIFHASSVLGAIFASLCGIILTDSDWRLAFLVGLTPALLILWIRMSLKESERWEQTRTATSDSTGAQQKMGSLGELLGNRRWRGRALLGLCLASIGLGTYWGIYAWGPELVRDVARNEVPDLEPSEVHRRVRDVLRAYAPEGVSPEDDLAMLQAALDKLMPGYVAMNSSGEPILVGEQRVQAGQALVALEQAIESIDPRSDGSLPSAETYRCYREILTTDLASQQRSQMGSFAYLMMNFTGGLLGLLAFAPLASITGRRTAFIVYHAGALVMAPVTFLLAASYVQSIVLLSVMAFFVVGMHAGYAIYFPELFPTRLRATGASFCFNLGRLLSAGMLIGRGYLRAFFTEEYGASLGLRYAVSTMALLFAVGLVLAIFAPETKDQELED